MSEPRLYKMAAPERSYWFTPEGKNKALVAQGFFPTVEAAEKAAKDQRLDQQYYDNIDQALRWHLGDEDYKKALELLADWQASNGAEWDLAANRVVRTPDGRILRFDLTGKPISDKPKTAKPTTINPNTPGYPRVDHPIYSPALPSSTKRRLSYRPPKREDGMASRWTIQQNNIDAELAAKGGRPLTRTLLAQKHWEDLGNAWNATKQAWSDLSGSIRQKLFGNLPVATTVPLGGKLDPNSIKHSGLLGGALLMADVIGDRLGPWGIPFKLIPTGVTAYNALFLNSNPNTWSGQFVKGRTTDIRPIFNTMFMPRPGDDNYIPSYAQYLDEEFLHKYPQYAVNNPFNDSSWTPKYRTFMNNKFIDGLMKRWQALNPIQEGETQEAYKARAQAYALANAASLINRGYHRFVDSIKSGYINDSSTEFMNAVADDLADTSWAQFVGMFNGQMLPFKVGGLFGQGLKMRNIARKAGDGVNIARRQATVFNVPKKVKGAVTTKPSFLMQGAKNAAIVGGLSGADYLVTEAYSPDMTEINEIQATLKKLLAQLAGLPTSDKKGVDLRKKIAGLMIRRDTLIADAMSNFYRYNSVHNAVRDGLGYFIPTFNPLKKFKTPYGIFNYGKFPQAYYHDNEANAHIKLLQPTANRNRSADAQIRFMKDRNSLVDPAVRTGLSVVDRWGGSPFVYELLKTLNPYNSRNLTRSLYDMLLNKVNLGGSDVSK